MGFGKRYIRLVRHVLRATLCLAFLLFSNVASGPVQAQEAVAEPLELGPSGEAYLRAKGRGVNANVGYYDPTRAVPPLETRQRVTPQAAEPDQEDRGLTLDRSITTLITVVVLGIVVFLFVRFGGGMSVSLRSQAENVSRSESAARSSKTGELDAESLQPIRQILRNPDRKMALILLARALLVQVVEANGLLLQRSWTARDALRRLPKTQPNLRALQNLVLASERVQFGNRDITEDEFSQHVRDVSPLLQGKMS
jgi:hypothetical protein